MVKSRLALGSPGCLFVVTMPIWSHIHKKMVVDCVLVLKAIGKITFPDHERGISGPASLLYKSTLRLVISCFGIIQY